MNLSKVTSDKGQIVGFFMAVIKQGIFEKCVFYSKIESNSNTAIL